MENPYKRIRKGLPSKEEIRTAISAFSKKERIFFVIFGIVLIVTSLSILKELNNSVSVDAPMPGGSLSEGVVGTPRFVNPILATTDADRDMTALVYSGLLRKSPMGEVFPDLAEGFEASDDGLSYTFTLRDNAYFHNGDKVTADDVIFTIDKVKDPSIKSPRKANWDGVTVDKINDKTVKFNLKQPYSAFLENATIGILPASLWKDSPTELSTYNTSPVGSGPYKIEKVSKESSGAVNSYDLEAFKKFTLGNPYIDEITMKFYPNEDELVSALQSGSVDQASSITPENALALTNRGYRIESSVLPRVFGLFFNQNEAQIFLDKNVTQAIDLAIDKDRIVREVLGGYGVVIDDPLPPNLINLEKLSDSSNISREESLTKAEEILAKDGWKKSETTGFLEKTTTEQHKHNPPTRLTVSIATGNAPELARTADIIKENLSLLGMQVDVKTFEIGNLNQSVIRPRQYDALLFGEIINHESDLFAFWHSSQRKDPGLNVALYTNAKVDKILEDALVTIDETARIKKYSDFENEIRRDMPAVFFYSPKFIYVVSKNLGGLKIEHITNSRDRFLNVYEWSVAKDKVWKIFSNQ